MRVQWPLLLVLSVLVCSCSTPTHRSAQVDTCQVITVKNADHCLRLNHVQVLGTHNSYKQAPNPRLLEMLKAYSEDLARELNYGHGPLVEQLERLGIRQLELDVFADPDGGLFADPAGARLTGDGQLPGSNAMQSPGLKVFHVQDIDYRSTCPTFKDCLTEIRDWSRRNPAHLPVMVLVEAKDQLLPSPEGLQYATPIPFTRNNIGDIDEEIWKIFSASEVITPDDVRGRFDTLEDAIQKRGWPTLAESRGKVIFALDNTDSKRDAYLSGAPNLEGRVLFVSSRPGAPTAGFIKMNNVFAQRERIQEYVAAGYLVRTRADTPGNEARSGSTKRRDQALDSGAQYVSTDYPEESPSGSGYLVKLPETEGIARCNPVSAPPECRARFLRE